MMKMVDNPHNGVTFCSGSYGTNLENDLPDMIRSLKGRIHFAHVRNLKFNDHRRDFEESGTSVQLTAAFDMYEIMKALYDIGFDGTDPSGSRTNDLGRSGNAGIRSVRQSARSNLPERIVGSDRQSDTAWNLGYKIQKISEQESLERSIYNEIKFTGNR